MLPSLAFLLAATLLAIIPGPGSLMSSHIPLQEAGQKASPPYSGLLSAAWCMSWLPLLGCHC